MSLRRRTDYTGAATESPRKRVVEEKSALGAGKPATERRRGNLPVRAEWISRVGTSTLYVGVRPEEVLMPR
jgi:hypothetical protein